MVMVAPSNAPTGVMSPAISGERSSRASTMRATIEPRAAPEETPSTYGSANGFRSSAWKLDAAAAQGPRVFQGQAHSEKRRDEADARGLRWRKRCAARGD